MTRVWFVMPVHGREELTRICLRQLERTCEAAAAFGVNTTAVVIGDDTSVDYADELGFATVRRNNDQLGRKFNDGYQFACDPEFNPAPADYVIPCGSDDWVDPVILRRMPGETIGVFRQFAVVDEDRTSLSRIKVGYHGGCGVRIIPRSLLARCGYRPAEEDISRGCDTSAIMGMYAVGRVMPKMTVLDVHPLQIVDWKSHGQQLNSYRSIRSYRHGDDGDVWDALAEHYPEAALDEMRALDGLLVAA